MQKLDVGQDKEICVFERGKKPASEYTEEYIDWGYSERDRAARRIERLLRAGSLDHIDGSVSRGSAIG